MVMLSSLYCITVTLHSRAGTDYWDTARAAAAAAAAGHRLTTPARHSLSLSLSQMVKIRSPASAPSWWCWSALTCGGHCQLLVSLSASRPVSDRESSSLSVWVWLSEAGGRREAGGGDRQGLRKCQINCKMMTCRALPCLPVTVGCFRLRLQDVRRSDIVTLSSRGQWSPWEQEADIFSHRTISDVKQ